MFLAALFTIVKTWQQCKGSSRDDWIKKIDDRQIDRQIDRQYKYIDIDRYRYNRILLSDNKNCEILPFAVLCMNPGNITLSKISQTEKDKYCVISLIFGSEIKYK